MEKRLILAVVLSVLVVLAFQYVFQPPRTTVPAPQQQTVSQPLNPVGEKSQPKAAPVTKQEQPALTNIKETETKIETEKYILTFSNIGGTLKKVILKEYNSLLIKIPGNETGIFGVTLTGISPSLDKMPFNVQQEHNKLIYTYADPSGSFILKKEFKFYNYNDYIELNVSIDNLSTAPFTTGYGISGPTGIQAATSMQGSTYIEVAADIDGRVTRKASVRSSGETYTGIITWVGLKNLYYAFIVKPTNALETLTLTQDPSKKINTEIFCKERTINPKMSVQDSYIVYMGPLTKKRITALNAGLDGIIDYGFFGPFTMLILVLLGWINMAVNNWGVAIIVVTIIINIVLFPLTKKSFLSMQKMQELQPHMQKLRETHKDNPQKLNKEVMELYKQYQVNPFGGCLPMLMQLPIFFGFYQALIHSIELKDAKFLWIKDLSGPDALFRFPQPLPFVGEYFNLLPLITLVVMVIQQRMTTSMQAGQASPEMVQQQKIMAILFPIFFGFILYNFPSGLVVYWLTNSILMTTEQLMLKKKVAVQGA